MLSGTVAQQNLSHVAQPGLITLSLDTQQDPIVLTVSISFKIRACNWLEVNWSTRLVNPELGWPDKNLVETFFFQICFFSYLKTIFFSNVFFLLPRDPSFFIFFNQLLTHFKVHYINIRRMFYFCNVGFETL